MLANEFRVAVAVEFSVQQPREKVKKTYLAGLPIAGRREGPSVGEIKDVDFGN